VGFDCLDIRSRRERHACASVFELRAELAAARDAARIETKLARQRQKLDNLAVVGTSANPQADVLSWMAGGALSADVWERLITIFVAALIELSAAMGLAITARSVVEILAEPQEPAPLPEPEKPFVPSILDADAFPLDETARMDPERAFLAWFHSCVGYERGERTKPKDAFDHFEAWRGLNGVQGELAYHTFGRRMSDAALDLGGEPKNSGGRYYAHIKLAPLSGGEKVEDE
jgi:hypothetical protein